MRTWSRSVSRLLAGFVAAALTVTLSIGVVSLALAQTTTTDTTPDDTTTTTSPPDTTPTTTTTEPDQGVFTPPPASTPTPTEPETTPPTAPGSEPAAPGIAPIAPPDAPDVAPPVTTHDNDIYVGTVTTLTGVQRGAIEAFLAATDRLGRAQTSLATTLLNPPTPSAKADVGRTPTRTSPSSLALIDSANALDRAIKRVALRAQETLGIAADTVAEDTATAIKAAQTAVDDAQAELDHATGVLRAVANGDPLITTLLTGKPPAGDGLAQRIAAAQAGQGNPPALDGIFALPIPGAPIVSAYGFRIDPIGGKVGFHPGVDISATQGTPILAAAAGTVLSAGDEGGYGNAVILDHGDSLSTLYGHMVRVAVSPGQHVEAGDVIGYVGSTGISTGPHLHFEVRIHGVTTDPLPTFKS